MGSDSRQMGRLLQAWRKVVAAYRQVYGFSHLQADCQRPGSALEPYARSEYGIYLILYFIVPLCQ